MICTTDCYGSHHVTNFLFFLFHFNCKRKFPRKYLLEARVFTYDNYRVACPSSNKIIKAPRYAYERVVIFNWKSVRQ